MDLIEDKSYSSIKEIFFRIFKVHKNNPIYKLRVLKIFG